MDTAVMPALVPLRVTTAVLDLSAAAQAGDERALRQLEAMAALLPEPR